MEENTKNEAFEEVETEESIDTLPTNASDEIQLQSGKELALKIAHILDERKAQDIKIINVNKKTVIADYFVIAGGNSRTQVNALADEVEYKIGLEGIKPSRVEGRGDGTWVLVDFDSVLVHIFGRESRDFYKLEKLWAEGTPVEFEMTEN
ncbi:MAG: ribosome silencing factor [Ruminococcaceae bacterium]|nr:ribosome silencing factor [Oscillospiraceae bacterium]